jgi:aspartyl-tRNA synthetase
VSGWTAFARRGIVETPTEARVLSYAGPGRPSRLARANVQASGDVMHRYRSHTCGELSIEHVGSHVRLSGWLHNRRDHRGLLFIDLRDHYGIVQLVVRAESDASSTLARMPKETVVRVDGAVLRRSPDNVNPDMATGEVEVEVSEVELLGPCDELPFTVFPEEHVSEEKRLTHRFLDLRRQRPHRNIMLRSKIIASLRQKLTALGFNEFQTPILTSSSPEGARDFLVPSRLHPGKFFALPQAPQQFKQLLMIAGFDRYFQIAPCFRDEDSRADRSPGEFYQLDLEMSFVEQDDVFSVTEQVLTDVFTEFASDRTVVTPFPRITYRDALASYGTDKPDLRVPLQLADVSGIFVSSSFRAFTGKHVVALSVPDCADQPRSFFDRAKEFAISCGAKGLAWLKVAEGGQLSGPIAKFLDAEQTQRLLTVTKTGPCGALFLNAADCERDVLDVMAPLRVEVGKRSGNFEEGTFRFCWIVDFPMYEQNDQGQIEFSHNPFSMPQGGLDALNTQDPLDVLAWQYDIVCNGVELSSGAIRNHRPEIMYRAFEIAGYPREEVQSKFGGMLQALQLGAPPHGGIAPGVDRIVMLISGEPNIRETIAFPLNQNAQDLMMCAPNEIPAELLADVHVRISLPERGDGRR